MYKRIRCVFILSLLIVIGTGCGQKPMTEGGTVQGSSTNHDQEISSTPTEEVAPPTVNASTDDQETVVDVAEGDRPVDKDIVTKSTDSVSSEKIAVYFTDPQAEELIEAEQEIRFSDEVEKYGSAFKALQSSNNPDLIPLWSKIELKSISFDAGDITMDIHMPDEARLGSGGESFALTALKKTLFQFEEVKSIELLVDNESVESLMGHVELEHPMVRDDASN
ncbi:GerMN domain-containing protein [Paenibacillus sp. FA6]|uniref:GerMN domain-containing protein n=1 Tax=Paenibacillus sp. FA6 TaxID=3413029 RepID=UPI003F6554AC